MSIHLLDQFNFVFYIGLIDIIDNAQSQSDPSSQKALLSYMWSIKIMVFTFQNSRRRIKPLPTKTVLVAEGNCCWDVYSRPGYRVRIVTMICEYHKKVKKIWTESCFCWLVQELKEYYIIMSIRPTQSCPMLRSKLSLQLSLSYFIGQTEPKIPCLVCFYESPVQILTVCIILKASSLVLVLALIRVLI